MSNELNAAVKSVETLVKSNPKKFARKSLYKALAKKFDRKVLKTAIDILRGRTKNSKRKFGVSDGGYFLLQN